MPLQLPDSAELATQRSRIAATLPPARRAQLPWSSGSGEDDWGSAPGDSWKWDGFRWELPGGRNRGGADIAGIGEPGGKVEFDGHAHANRIHLCELGCPAVQK